MIKRVTTGNPINPPAGDLTDASTFHQSGGTGLELQVQIKTIYCGA